MVLAILPVRLDQFAAVNLQIASAVGVQPADPFAAVSWVSGLLLGPIGTSCAVIAVAWFGYGMLGGRLSVRRGWLLVLGCFILFSAPSLAAALSGLARQINGSGGPLPPSTIAVPPPLIPNAPPAYDPYAGASVPN